MSKPENPLRAADYFVKDVGISAARDLVTLYHYAQGASRTRVYTHGLYHRDRPDDCLGVAWWMPPTKPAAASVSLDWRSVLSLSRLVIAPDMPTNAASFLLGQSMQMIRQIGAWHTLLTYADAGEGHTGAIYLATNWTYLGTRGATAVWKDAEGRHVAKQSTRTRTIAEMAALGFVNTGKTHKHKFVMYLTKESRKLEKVAA